MNSKLAEAKKVLNEEVFLPALEHESLDAGKKQAIRQTRSLIDHFRGVGDLKLYLARFDDNSDTSNNAQALRKLGLKTFESIKSDFLRRFSDQSDRFYVDDLVIGDECNSTEISILSQTYNNRSGGILEAPLRNGTYGTIAKINIGGVRYKNEWIESDISIKFYLQARKNIFDENYEANKRILDNRDRDIFCFDRIGDSGKYTYRGIFRFAGIFPERRSDKESPKWFEIRRVFDPITPRSKIDLDRKLALDVSKSHLDTSAERQIRLARAPRIPEKRYATSTVFMRNPDVIAEVLYRANGVCEECNKTGPFVKRLDGSHYLEVHHKIPLAQGGEDTVENAVALCPNCHRNEHHGVSPRWPCPPAAIRDTSDS